MRFLALFILICLPAFASAEERFGAWVTRELNNQPFFTQSIGWDMPDPSVTIADPILKTEGDIGFIDTPNSTAWVVGILDSENEARLSGLGLVWSDDPIDRAVSWGVPQTQSGYVAFQTPRQTLVDEALPDDIALQMMTATPGPILVVQPDETEFPTGDSGITGGCFEATALYNDADALVAVVVLFQSGARVDTDETACGALTS